jgi:predicted MFS family arabinose efflux permease
MSRLFSSRALRCLFGSRFISATGDKMFAIGLSWWVVADASIPDRELMLGLLLAVATLPIALSGPLFGPLIDKVDKRACLVVADVGRFVLAGLLAIVIHQGLLTIPLLFGLCIPLFALTPLFDAAASASLSPLSSGPQMLSQLVAVESAIPNLASTLGALFGSWALAIWGVEGAFWFNAASFLLSLLLVLRLPALVSKPDERAPKQSRHRYAFLRRYPDTALLMVLFGLINFFVAPVFLYLPLLTRDVLGGAGLELSLLELAFALGNLLLFAYFTVWPRTFVRTRWLRFVLVASAAGLMWLLAEAVSLPAMFAVLLVWGWSIGFVTYLALSAFQRSIPDEFKGRFFALLGSVCTLAIPLSFALFGFLSSRIGLQELMYGNAAGALLVSFGFLPVGDDPPEKPAR